MNDMTLLRDRLSTGGEDGPLNVSRRGFLVAQRRSFFR
jgi:hypothetical protein